MCFSINDSGSQFSKKKTPPVKEGVVSQNASLLLVFWLIHHDALL